MIKADRVQLNVRKGHVWLNGLIVGTMTYSDTLKSHWLRMRNIDDSIIEGDSEESCIFEAKNIVAKWLNDLIEESL